MDETAESYDLVEQEEPDPDGFQTVHYTLSGTVDWVRPETSEASIRCGDVTFLDRLRDLERAARKIGDRVRARCGLAVVPEYERLAFSLADVRRTWRVEAVKVEHRAIGWRDDQGFPGQVLTVRELDQIHRWADEVAGQHMSYLLNLSPT